jgi:hypothetical protein
MLDTISKNYFLKMFKLQNLLHSSILSFLLYNFKFFLICFTIVILITFFNHFTGRAGKILDITQKVVTTIAAGTIAY